MIEKTALVDAPHVALFVTCLVDLTRPSVGFATIKLLEESGCRISVPEAQTCCAQPAYNSGDKADARAIARQVIAAFEGYDYVVVPSGSCGGMIAKYYPEIFADDPEMLPRAEALAAQTWELTSFLHDVMQYRPESARLSTKTTYHDSCSGLRELGVKAQPRELLGAVEGLSITEGEMAETCCGFGGLFCVKYPEVSSAMVDKKVDDIVSTGADTVLGGDLGCLMNLAGRMHRRGEKVAAWHIAEVLADMTDDVAPIGGEAED